MFRPGETVSVSYNKYGYHSIPIEEVLTAPIVTLVPTPESCEKRKIEWSPENFEKINTEKLTLVALNPIKGFREDRNATHYRNFLVEMDDGTADEQMAYIKRIGMPYSAVVFSGNKSLHFLISLDKDLPSENVYRVFSMWTLAIAQAADQNTINPSRSIRIPGAEREPGKFQRLVEYRGPVSINEMSAWLNKFPNCKPQKPEKREISAEVDFSKLKSWVADRLVNGLLPNQGRNKQWFSIACEFALAGYSEDDTLDILGGFFTPDRDFKEREWKTAIHSGFKYIYERK